MKRSKKTGLIKKYRSLFVAEESEKKKGLDDKHSSESS